MKKQLLSLSLFVACILPALVFAGPLPIHIPSFDPNDVTIADIEDFKPVTSLHPDIEMAEGGQLYICNSKNLQMRTVEVVEGPFISLPLDAFEGDNGSRNIALHNSAPQHDSVITNTSEGIDVLYIKVRTQSTHVEGRWINKIFTSEGEATPYMDYISANSHKTPCDKNRITYGKITIDHEMGWLVAQLHSAEEEASPEPAPEVAPPAAPEFQENAAPQSGGCNMTTTFGGFNYALSILFALTLGAHTLLRFRKK